MNRRALRKKTHTASNNNNNKSQIRCQRNGYEEDLLLIFYRMGILGNEHPIKCALSCHIALCTELYNFRPKKKIFSSTESVWNVSTDFSVPRFSLDVFCFYSHFQLSMCAMVPSSQLSTDFLERQTSINDCLSRNIDDLTNSPGASTLYIYPFVSQMYMKLEYRTKFSANITCSFFMCHCKSQIIVNIRFVLLVNFSYGFSLFGKCICGIA